MRSRRAFLNDHLLAVAGMLGGNPEMELIRYAAGMKKLILDNGVMADEGTGLPYFTGYASRTLYDIDMYLEAITLCYLGRTDLSKNCIRLFLLEQDGSTGFIPRNIVRVRRGKNSYYEKQEHVKPFLSQTALLLSHFDQDFGWIDGAMLARLRLYLCHWLDQCDRNGNGLSEWCSAPHAGADNQFERAGGWLSNHCEGVDLNSYLVRECLALALLYEKYGDPQQATDLRSWAEARKKAVLRLWDDRDEMFYDRDRRTGEPIRVPYAMAYMTLWCEVFPQEWAKRSVPRHLLNPAEFWTPCPVSTYPLSSPHFSQLAKRGDYSACNFRGSLWIPYNYWLMHGLRKYGYAAEAKRLAERSCAVLRRFPAPREWYDSQTGEGRGKDPFWGFSALAIFMPLELEFGVDPTDLNGVNLRDNMRKVSERLRLLDHPT